MPQLSGLKRSMPCEDLCSMMVPTDSSSSSSSSSTTSMMTPQLVKDYDSDDASATSCIELSSLLKLNSRILASYNDQGLIDDVWDFQAIDFANQSSSKRQKYTSSISDTAVLCPATEALTLVLEEAQVTLDKLMDMHIHRICPMEPAYQPQSSRLVHPFADQSVMNLTRLTGRTMV